MAQIARFYGWTPQVIEALQMDRLQAYKKSMETLKAAEALEMISCVSHPHRTHKSQQDVVSKLQKLIPGRPTQSIDDVELMLRSMRG